MIESIYLVCGLVLPAFYWPQIVRIYRDNTKLAGYSLTKAVSQFLLRIPAVLFGLFIVQNQVMNWVVGLDVFGRTVELVVAVLSLRRQGVLVERIVARWVAGRARRLKRQASVAFAVRMRAQYQR